jgi:hypothetical protein
MCAIRSPGSFIKIRFGIPMNFRNDIKPLKILSRVVVLFRLFSILLVAADYYKLPSTKRIDKDLYRSGKILIETRYCYHYSYGEDAILRYEGPGQFSGSTIIWDDDSTCEVKNVISE